MDTPRLALSQELMIPASTLDGLLRDRLLLMRQLSGLRHSDFERWERENNQTSLADHERQRVVFALKSMKDGLEVESYLERLGVVPDYKNNRKLLVIDLAQLVGVLSRVQRGQLGQRISPARE